jgi:hypothetical protein
MFSSPVTLKVKFLSARSRALLIALCMVTVILFLFLIQKWHFFFYNTGTYIDKKCPFTGNVSIRGRILAGTCHSAKMNRTIIVRRNYLHFIKKYQRYWFPFILWSPFFICTLGNIIYNSLFFLLLLYLGMRRGIQTFQLMSHLASVLRKEIMLLSDNAGETL